MFPSEIYLEILLRLPVQSTFVCKCVCKTWFSLISDPSFVKSHFNLTIQTNKPNLILKGYDWTRNRNRNVIYSISHNSLPSFLSRDEEFLEYAVELDYPFKNVYGRVHVMGCCDGLVCLSFCLMVWDKSFLCLWNPATKEYKELPTSPEPMYDETDDYNMIGLGYDCKTEDYKLVVQCTSIFEVYSLRSNSWTSIESVPYEFHRARLGGVLVNRDLHWLANLEEARDCSEVVVCLDMCDQIFKEIQLPNKPLVCNYMFMDLGVLEGCLCVVGNVHNVHSDVWVMQDYGVKESWTKRYMINHERIVNDYLQCLMWSFKSGELLFGTYASCGLVIYDPNDESAREPNMHGLKKSYVEGCYYESLVSLGSGTFVGGEEEDD